MGLLDVYNNMRAAQEEQEKVAEVQTEQYQEVDARLEELEKYASFADELLTQEFGDDYSEDDVVKLAELMISHDVEMQQEYEKVAELHEAGIIMAKAFKEELARS